MQDAVRKYNCSICNLLLSIPPVMVTQDGDKLLYKCGRCQRTGADTYKWTRNLLFEEMAHNWRFPCSYPACTESLAWSKVQDHEENCLYKTIKCPLSDKCKCSDDILVELFGDHAAMSHDKDLTIAYTGENYWRVINNYNNIYFVELDNQYFFLYIQTWRSIAVMATRSSKYVRFNVGLKFNTDDNYAATVTDLPIIPYSSNISADSFTNNISNRVPAVFSTRRSQPISVGITFVADGTKDSGRFLQEDEALKHIPLRLNVEALKKALTCPYCMTYMAAPIFTCFKGHTICSGCKSRLEKCPTCEASLDGPRNYTLEAMAEDVELHCQFKASGCSFAGNTSTLRRHEMECPSSELAQNE